MLKIFLFQIILIAIKSSYAADVNYTMTPGALICFPIISNVVSANDTINVVGQPANYVDTTIDYIRLEATSMFNVFPYNIFKTFPSLTALDLINNNIIGLTTNTFGTCAKLTNLVINNQMFMDIPAGFAQNCASLKYLSFANYKLRTVDPDALQGLTSLISFHFQSCGLTCIPKGFFSHTPAIESIGFYQNSIKVIDPITFKGLPNLNSLDFWFNSISHIPNLDMTVTSSNATSLFVRLNGNPVSAIHPQLLDSMYQSKNYALELRTGPSDCFPAETIVVNANWTSAKTSTYINCFNNWTPAMDNETIDCGTANTISTTTTTTTTLLPITQPPTTLPPTKIPLPTTNAPGSCSSDKICRYYLDYLDRYTCVLDGVDGTITSISGSHISSIFSNANVTRVYFKNSFLSRIPQVLFNTFANLDFLSVANCSLGMITNATITVCGNLSYLDARFNDIFHVSSGAFKNCKNLQIIDFTGNPIERFDTAIFTFDPSLKKVILNDANA